MPGRDFVLNYFREKSGISSGERLFFSPGRVNLIGEHIDYNGGLVFPCAIDKGIYAAAAVNSSGKINLYSANFPLLKCSINNNYLEFDKNHGWMNYPKGVLKNIFELSGVKSGLDIAFHGNLPDGAGLSSSACIEMLTAVIADTLLELNIPMLELVKLCQKTENDYIGVNCGIMDQFAIGFGRKNSAILLNCATLDYSYAPFNIDGHSLIIINSNKRRELAESKYNERRAECESALGKLNKFMKAENLCSVNESDLELHKENLTKTEYHRALHVITENKRTTDAAEALKNNNLKLFGELMNSSHLSLKNNYEVTGHELDTLALTAQKMDFVLGSRMTGAGFGGCVIALIEGENFDRFKKEVGEIYQKECGLSADFYEVRISDGTGEI
ncbi:MAG: galactokinase [Spirochaetae bacterium HGW-Spirochaetae-5]|nr:MAG: galactokinase [Spirochaetae bacterium HGW-Spirochaetae-5]